MMADRPPRPFTGRHMLAILVAFFGIVFAVNFTMARLASSTFGGTVVDNSYVASQKFNGWIAKGRAQAAQGLRVEARRLADRRVALVLRDGSGRPVAGRATVTAEHPLGTLPARDLDMTGEGPWESGDALPAGRWQLKIEVVTARGPARFRADLP